MEDGPSSRMVGGLELSLHFAHTSDRQRVLEAARSVGWSPGDPAVEQDDWQEEGGCLCVWGSGGAERLAGGRWVSVCLGEAGGLD